MSSYSPEDLARLNRIELAVMGVPEELSLRFIQHRWYSPRHETALVESLSALDLTGDRGAFIEAAVTAESEEDARAYQWAAELMRRYDGGVGHIEKIIRVEGTVTGLSENGVLVVPLAADHAVWSRPTAQFAKTFTERLPDGIAVREAALLLSGSLSPRARTEFRHRGVRVIERALDRLPAEADTGGE